MQNNQNAPNGGQINESQLQELMKKFRSKADLYKYMDQVLQVYLPRDKACPLFFLHQILSNQKQHLMKNQVKNLKVPLWNELSVTNIWPQAITHGNFLAYIPDEWNQNQKKVERKFFWSVLIFHAEEYVEALLKDCREQRVQAQLQKIQQPQQINIAQNWIQPLLSEPFISNHGHQNILISRQQPVQRRQAPPQRVIQPRVTMQDWLNHQQQMQQQNVQPQPAQQVVIQIDQHDQQDEDSNNLPNINSNVIQSQPLSASAALMQVANYMRDNFQNDQREGNLEPIQEVNDIDQNSLNTEQQLVQQNISTGIQFLPEINKNNQLEFDSTSEYNSVMGQSPVKASNRGSMKTRKQKGDVKPKQNLDNNE